MNEKRKTRVILSKDAEKTYLRLKERAKTSKKDRSVFNSIGRKVELIKQDPHYGNPIAKSLIPEEYRKKYGISNLFRVELAGFWRMLYTLVGSEEKIEIIAFVLEISSHGEYDERFGYKGK